MLKVHGAHHTTCSIGGGGGITDLVEGGHLVGLIYKHSNLQLQLHVLFEIVASENMVSDSCFKYYKYKRNVLDMYSWVSRDGWRDIASCFHNSRLNRFKLGKY